MELGDEIRSIFQRDNIKKGINYEHIIYKEIENGNSGNTKLVFNIDTISFEQFKSVMSECLSNPKYKYYFPGVSILDENGKETENDAFLIEDNTIKIVELKKNLAQIDTGKSDNVYDRIIKVKTLLKNHTTVDIQPLIVGMENKETDKFYRLQVYCNDGDIMTGREFLKKLELDYDKINNKVNNINSEDVINDFINVLYKYNNKQ